MNFIEKYSTRKNIIIGLIFIAFINIVAFPYFPILFNVDTYSVDYILDIKFGFTLEVIELCFEKMKEDGRNIYLLLLLIFHMLLYMVLYIQ